MVLDAAADSTWTCRYIAILLLLTEMRYISLIPTSLIFYFLKKLLKTSCLDYIIIFYPLFFYVLHFIIVVINLMLFEGLVRSPISATLPQIGSRLFLTWGILWSFPEVSLVHH